jgi:hypothetical protein
MNATPTRTPRRALIVLLVLVVVTAWSFQAFGDLWKSHVAYFPRDGGHDYRLRVTGSADLRCAKLERRVFDDMYNNWIELGRDCSWPRVAGGDGWLAGGQIDYLGAYPPDSPPGAILYGIVPAAAASVTITLTDRTSHDTATIDFGHDDFRVYALYVPGITAPAEVTALQLHDAAGGRVHVY